MSVPLKKRSVWLGACGGWYLPNTAWGLHQRDALAALWISEKNSRRIPSELFRRCWPFHLALKPFLHLAPQIWSEKLFYLLFPLWRRWLARQQWPEVEVVHAIMGYATEPFDHAEKVGALKVVDAPNSHPVTYHGFWQRECDLWCPGEKVPIPQWMFARMNRELQQADLVLVLSKFCRESMILNGISPDKVVVYPMGVDTTTFRKREQVPDKVRFITVGTICLRKGHQYLFRAWEIVRKKLPEAELICVGDYKTDFRLERSKWEGSFIHHRYLSHGQLAKLLGACTAFVFPSQEEGFARVQLEAMASGLPVIGTHEGGLTTMVDDGVEGFIINGRDPAQIAEAMIKVAMDRELNRRMGDAACRKVAAQNTWLDYADHLLAAYQEKKDRKGSVA